MPTVKCENCGNDFIKVQHHYNLTVRRGWKHYCSPDCRDKARAGQRAYPNAPAEEYRKYYNRKKWEKRKKDPKYQKDKSEYNRTYKAKKNYGPLWEVYLLTRDLRDEIATRATRQEIYEANGTVRKAEQRRMHYDRLNSNKPKERSMGNAE